MQLTAKSYLKYQFRFLISYLVQNISYYFTNTTSKKKKVPAKDTYLSVIFNIASLIGNIYSGVWLLPHLKHITTKNNSKTSVHLL